jgi:hypothetical protein
MLTIFCLFFVRPRADFDFYGSDGVNLSFPDARKLDVPPVDTYTARRDNLKHTAFALLSVSALHSDNPM